MALDEARRPWPAPRSRWLWSQTWRDLLLLHWPIDAALLRPLVPPPLEIDRFDGQAWISVVPFLMDRVRPRGLPAVPALSSFPELNVRTYVTFDGKPGVFFLRIYAGGRTAAWLARRLSGLPYRFAPMRVVRTGGNLELEVDAEEGFAASYALHAEGAPAARGTLDHWLVERYCLYCEQPGGRVDRGEIDHDPWIIHPAQFELSQRGLLERVLPLEGPPARAHVSSGVTVRAWRFCRIA